MNVQELSMIKNTYKLNEQELHACIYIKNRIEDNKNMDIWLIARHVSKRDDQMLIDLNMVDPEVLNLYHKFISETA